MSAAAFPAQNEHATSALTKVPTTRPTDLVSFTRSPSWMGISRPAYLTDTTFITMNWPLYGWAMFGIAARFGSVMGLQIPAPPEASWLVESQFLMAEQLESSANIRIIAPHET